jgi:predicted nuclease of predicted toxin-antitoxin system
VRILVDMNLSPRWREALLALGYEAVWWRDVGPANAPDEELFAWARERGYVILTADLDFGHLLSLTGEAGPSVILLRLPSTEPPEALSSVLEVLKRFSEDLESGALAVIGPEKTRLRLLPLQ